MIGNARMYSVAPAAAAAWRSLLAAVAARAGVPLSLVEHPPPAPLEELWARSDLGAVFMCGLPFARAHPPPLLIAAPVPAPAWPRTGGGAGDVITADDTANTGTTSPGTAIADTANADNANAGTANADAATGGALYRSELVVRRDSSFATFEDTRGHRVAMTVPGSQSGCLALLGFLADLAGAGSPRPAPPTEPWFREVIEPCITPRGVLDAVIGGQAEVAPVDSYAFALMRKHLPGVTDEVRVIARTALTPMPPLVASHDPLAGDAIGRLRQAFLDAHRQVDTEQLLRALLLDRFTLPDAGRYALLARRATAAVSFWRTHRFAATIHPAFAFIDAAD